MSTLRAKVKFVDGMQFVGEGQSGHAVVMDGSPNHGGGNTGMRPTELLLLGLGGCTGMDVISILKKKKQKVTALEINVTGTKTEDHPTRFTDVTIEYVIRGRGVEDAAVKRAVELSMDRYCSVKATLEGQTKVGFSYRIEEDGTGEA